MHPEWWAERIKLDTPGRPRPWMVRALLRFARPLVRLCHRPVLEGIENLPASGPFLLVANHSGGLAIAEIFSFAVSYLEQAGPERPLAGFAHPVSFHLWPASVVLPAMGAIPSSKSAGEAVLKAGVPILVFPGGDHEALRPIWQANRVDFGGRMGFLRLARKAQVPIVPMGIRGSHYTMPILWRAGGLVPKLLILPALSGVKRWPITVLGVAGALLILGWLPLDWPWRIAAVWAWLGSPFVAIPWIPWKIRMRIGAPISVAELFGEGATDEAALALVQGKVQALVDRQAAT